MKLLKVHLENIVKCYRFCLLVDSLLHPSSLNEREGHVVKFLLHFRFHSIAGCSVGRALGGPWRSSHPSVGCTDSSHFHLTLNFIRPRPVGTRYVHALTTCAGFIIVHRSQKSAKKKNPESKLVRGRMKKRSFTVAKLERIVLCLSFSHRYPTLLSIVLGFAVIPSDELHSRSVHELCYCAAPRVSSKVSVRSQFAAPQPDCHVTQGIYISLPRTPPRTLLISQPQLLTHFTIDKNNERQPTQRAWSWPRRPS